MVTTQQILDLFARHPGKALSLRDLQAVFALDAGERKALGRQLKQLERDGVLSPAKEGSILRPAAAAPLAGTIALHRDGFAFVTPDGTDGSATCSSPPPCAPGHAR